MNKKIAVVSGSEGQLGVEYTKTLSALGYTVFGLDIKNSSVNDLIQYRKVDIRNKVEVEGVIQDIASHGEILVLLNNAGVSVFSPFEERTSDEIDFVIDVNLKGTLYLTQSVYNYSMKKNKAGKIVNIGSIYGKVAGDMNLYREDDRRTPEIYGATKAAIINLTVYFAAYMAPHNVQVNCISPGGIFNHQNPEFIRKYENRVPAKRMGEAKDLQKTLEYLISFENNYLTGQNIIVDGGFTAW